MDYLTVRMVEGGWEGCGGTSLGRGGVVTKGWRAGGAAREGWGQGEVGRVTGWEMNVLKSCLTIMDGMKRPPGTATPLARAISMR